MGAAGAPCQAGKAGSLKAVAAAAAPPHPGADGDVGGQHILQVAGRIVPQVCGSGPGAGQCCKQQGAEQDHAEQGGQLAEPNGLPAAPAPATAAP